MKRLDTHLRVSAQCKQVSAAGLSDHQPLLPGAGPVPQSQTDPPEQVQASQSHGEPPPLQPQEAGASPPPPELRPFRCPKSEQDWAEADQYLASEVVPAVFATPTLEGKNHVLCSGIYHFFTTNYGSHSLRGRAKKSRKKSGTSLHDLKQQRNKLRSELRHAKRRGDDAEAISAVAVKFHQLIRQYSRVSRAERQSTHYLTALKQRRECARRFHSFAKEVLDGDGARGEIEPTFDADTAHNFFQEVYSSEPREFQQPQWLPTTLPPVHPFDESPVSMMELEQVIKRVRVRSSPSPLDQVTYKVIRRCPSLWPALLHLYNMCWEQHRVPLIWKQGVICLIPKSAAKEASHIPSNFRPIALTSCVGKLFSTILKTRWLHYMVSNNFLDTSVQKAFLPGVPGCLEHYKKLSAIIRDAHKKHRSLSVCWLDLANAYGSVHHQLISFCLQHYHAPQSFIDSVMDIYSGLSASFQSSKWSTAPVPLRVGVYQGDPLSPIIFNTVMSTLVDSLKKLNHCGYTLSGSSISTSVLLYADDVCLVSDGPASGQHLLSQVERWLHWSGMTAKIPKCFSLAIRASSAKRFDPNLKLAGQVIPSTGSKSIKFLGGPISIPANKVQHQQHLEVKLKKLMERVDDTAVSGKQKLLLYKAGVCPRLSWDLAVMDLPTSWISTVLEAHATRFLKKWSGLARPADTARLYLPKKEGGLALPPLTLLYKRLKVSQGALLLTSRDRVTQHLVSRSLREEESRVRIQFKPMLLCRDVMCKDPSASRQTLATRAKRMVSFEDAERRREHTESLPVQGLVMRVHTYACDIWASVAMTLKPEELKFVLNAVTDTLPHNANLEKWRKGKVESGCKLCGEKQTLLHILNHCEVALQLRRYNKRHDEVLSIISELTASHLPACHHLTTDLSGVEYQFPIHIVPTNLRPDLVIWSDAQKSLNLIELTICFESGFLNAATRKLNRYAELASAAQAVGYKTSVVPIQIGSLGVLEESGLDSFRKCLTPISTRKWEAFLTAITSTTIEESYKIWCARNRSVT